MLNLSALVVTAVRVAKQQGLVGAVTLRRPAIGAAAELVQTVDAVQLRETDVRRFGGGEVTARLSLLVLGADLAWVPTVGDFGTFGGEMGAVMAAPSINPAGGAPIAYLLQLGGEGF